MSKFDMSRQIRLNVISRNNEELRISIIVGNTLTISHLKRKIETQLNQLHGVQVVVRVIEDSKGFIISNNSNVDEHFSSGDTIFFSEHEEKDKSSSFNMNLSSNIGQILSTMKFMTGSVLQKLDKINLTATNTLEIATDLLHLGMWYSNIGVVKRLFKIYNKMFDEESIEKFITQASQIHISMLIKNFTFWFIQVPNSLTKNSEVIWQLMQLIQKFTCNLKFVQIIKANKLVKSLLQISKNQLTSPQLKKMSVKIIKNINGGGRNRNQAGNGFTKTKSSYIPTLLGTSNYDSQDVQEILSYLSSSSQDQKIQGLQMLAEANFSPIAEATVRFDYYQKLMGIFAIRKFKSRKHLTIFNQVLTHIMNNTSKQKYIQIMQKDILKRVHQFLLEAPVDLHSNAIEFIGRTCKTSGASGMLNIQKAMQLIDSPYPQYQKHLVTNISAASSKINTISAIKFIPGIRDCIKVSLKTNNDEIAYELLRTMGNLTLDQQCRYQIINLKGIEVFVKFLETSANGQINKACAKGLLNLAISSRENKAKVLNSMNNILEIFYKGKYDSVTNGFIQTILKSKNI